MTTTILLDIGSSTVKVYSYNKTQGLVLCQTKSFDFKEGYSATVGLSTHSENKLIQFLQEIKDKNKDKKVHLYATAIFRKLEPAPKAKLVETISKQTGLTFTIIDHDIENAYLQTALLGRYKTNEPVLIINIGGGSTEFAVIKNNHTIESHNIELGVGTVLSMFPKVNNNYSDVKLEHIVDFVKTQLPRLKTKVSKAFYTGGELNYMKLANYNLEVNRFFKDALHPSIISAISFKARNAEIFDTISLTELEELMPENPLWMHGSRPCSGIAQAIIEKYTIETIIPSDSNLIDGVVRKDFS